MHKNTIKADTFCPIFPGFYETIFSFDNMFGDMEYTLFNDPDSVDKEILDYIMQELLWDNVNNQDYEAEVGRLCCEYIAEKCGGLLPGIVQGITFEKIYSPKEYNFKTDSIDCSIEVDFDKLLKTFISHPDSADYLKDTYTSRSGFISYYPNNLREWAEKAFDDQGHTTGAMLEFLLQAESDDLLYDLYEYISENIYAGEFIDYDNMLEAINDNELCTVITLERF